jgi:hypothetical protein
MFLFLAHVVCNHINGFCKLMNSIILPLSLFLSKCHTLAFSKAICPSLLFLFFCFHSVACSSVVLLWYWSCIISINNLSLLTSSDWPWDSSSIICWESSRSSFNFLISLSIFSRCSCNVSTNSEQCYDLVDWSSSFCQHNFLDTASLMIHTSTLNHFL